MSDLQSYFHMTPVQYDVGDLIHGNGLTKGHKPVSDALETFRIDDLKREHAVFCRPDKDFHLCAIPSPGSIYRVVPLVGAPIRKYDLNWLKPMDKAQARLKSPYLAKSGYPEWSDNLLEECCIPYWAGEPTQEPFWEYLFPSVKVVEVVSRPLVDPSSTKGGWTAV